MTNWTESSTDIKQILAKKQYFKYFLPKFIQAGKGIKFIWERQILKSPQSPGPSHG